MGGWNAQPVVGASSLGDGKSEVVWVQGEDCRWVLMRGREKQRWEGSERRTDQREEHRWVLEYYVGYNRV